MNKDLDYYKNLEWTRVFKKYPDGLYFAEIKELKGCMTEAGDIKEAEELLEDALTAWLEVAIENNLDIPEPGKSEDIEKYSGKFNVRVPRSLHKLLIERSKRENVSLNSIINMLLNRGLA